MLSTVHSLPEAAVLFSQLATKAGITNASIMVLEMFFIPKTEEFQFTITSKQNSGLEYPFTVSSLLQSLLFFIQLS